MISYEENSSWKRPLQGVFTSIPPRYDLINRIVTWGLDKWWRLEAAKECLASQPKTILDLGCGTGDLAISIACLADGTVELNGIDYSRPMLELATAKAKRLARGKRLSFVYGDAANLPFPDGYFDCVGISFAFRNLTYKNPLAARHIAEVLRALSPNGRFIIVESSQPKRKLVQQLFHLYLRCFVFRVGHLLSGNRSAYQYLAESAVRFYNAEEVGEILRSAGFRQVFFRPLLLGIASIHTAIK